MPPLPTRCCGRVCSALTAAMAALLLTGCGTLENGRAWGQDARLWPGFGRIGRAAVGAALEPGTWMPAAGALVFTIDDFDRRVSDWAIDHQPLYGSLATAEDINLDFLDALKAGTFATAFATPSGRPLPQECDAEDQDTCSEDVEPQPDETRPWGDQIDSLVKVWLPSKAKGITLEWLAWRATVRSTLAIKDWAHRTRPDGSDNQGFPSGDASRAFAYATLTSRNLESIPLPSGTRAALQLGVYGMASAVAWARVERGAHFPSDVLAGAALGHFVSAFIHDAFLGLPENDRMQLIVAPMEGGGWAQVGWAF